MNPSKSKFDRIKAKSKKSVCDIAYLSKFSFGSQNKNFYNKTFKGRKDVGVKYQNAHKEDYKEKLKNTTITNEDFAKVMKMYDSPSTFFYADPPYVVGGNAYKVHGVTPKEVCDVAKKMEGKVLISYDNRPEVRTACKGLKMKTVSTRYTLPSDSNNMKTKELLLANYKI